MKREYRDQAPISDNPNVEWNVNYYSGGGVVLVLDTKCGREIVPDGMTEFCIVCCTYVMQLYRFGYFINFFDARKRMHHFRDVAFSLHLSARSEQKWVIAETTKSVFYSLHRILETRKETRCHDWLSHNDIQ